MSRELVMIFFPAWGNVPRSVLLRREILSVRWRKSTDSRRPRSRLGLSTLQIKPSVIRFRILFYSASWEREGEREREAPGAFAINFLPHQFEHAFAKLRSKLGCRKIRSCSFLFVVGYIFFSFFYLFLFSFLLFFFSSLNLPLYFFLSLLKELCSDFLRILCE